VCNLLHNGLVNLCTLLKVAWHRHRRLGMHRPMHGNIHACFSQLDQS
jgi:hypothetical protein